MSRGLRPGEPQSPQRVRPGVRKESKKSPKLRFWTLFGLRGALFGDSGAPRGRRPRDTLSDSFRTLLGLRARRAREHSVPGRGVPNISAREVSDLAPFACRPFLDTVRGPRMGHWIRPHWICDFGAPRYLVQRPQTLTSDTKLLRK